MSLGESDDVEKEISVNGEQEQVQHKSFCVGSWRDIYGGETDVEKGKRSSWMIF